MKTKMKIGLVAALLCVLQFTYAQSERDKYLQVITERSDKIVSTLGVTDSVRYKQVRSIVVQQYDQLNSHHEAREAKIKTLKEQYAAEKQQLDQKRTALEAQEDVALRQLHSAFLTALKPLLKEEQIEAIKNRMTYGVLPLTYGAYQDMIPQLKETEKEKILNYLTEARELAMDEPGSREKHQVFGKFKGRINNYLSAQGYDLKEEGKKWEERKAQKQAGG